MHPQEIEEVARGVSGVRPGGIAAFGVQSQGTEAVVVVVETRETDRAAITAAVKPTPARRVGFTPEAVVAVAPGCVPRTSSGKVRPRRVPRAVSQRPSGTAPPGAGAEMARMMLNAFWSRATSSLWGAFCWATIATGSMPPLITVLVRRDPDQVMRVASPCARAIFRITGLWPTITGGPLPDGPAGSWPTITATWTAF